MSCRFYGKNGMYGRLLEQGGNECALIVSHFAPCVMERDGDRVDEARCPLVAHAQQLAGLIHIAGMEPLPAIARERSAS